MNIIDHELKRHELWQEELSKKKKADILLEWHFILLLLPVVITFDGLRWFCSFFISFCHSHFLEKCKKVLKVKMKIETIRMNID